MMIRGTGRDGNGFAAPRDAEAMLDPEAVAGFVLFPILIKMPSGP
jgi:hypothetical protein